MKEMQDLQVEISKMLLKEIKEDLDKWKDTPYLWMKRLNTYLPRLLTGLNETILSSRLLNFKLINSSNNNCY